MKSFFSFPNPVNDKAARTVAAVVLVGVIVTLVTGWYWLLIPITYGFWARVLAGPKLSPLAWTAMNVIAPRLGEKVYVPGPAQALRAGDGRGDVVAGAAVRRWSSATTRSPTSSWSCSSPPPASSRSSDTASAARRLPC